MNQRVNESGAEATRRVGHVEDGTTLAAGVLRGVSVAARAVLGLRVHATGRVVGRVALQANVALLAPAWGP